MESSVFNSLLHSVAQDERYNTEMGVAKEEFAVFAGQIFETDRNYYARINSFHNWYILDRPLKSRGMTPLGYYLEYNANTLSSDEFRDLQELLGNRHSLFELLRTTPTHVQVRDLFSGEKFEVEGGDGAGYLDKGVLFNTRLFQHSGRVYFSNYFILHPSEVFKRLRLEARKLRKSRTDPKSFLFRLLLYQSRWDQYKQMELKNIYRFDD